MGIEKNYLTTLFFLPDISGFTTFVNQVEDPYNYLTIGNTDIGQ